jgi:hypothetical protein
MIKQLLNLIISITPIKIINLQIIRKIFFKESIFKLFFSKQYNAVIEKYDQIKYSKKLSDDEVHLVFASKIIVKDNVEEILKKIKNPPSIKFIKKLFKVSLKNERNNKNYGVLSQPKYINKSILAAIIGMQNNKKYFVETGTYIGKSTYNIQQLFKKVYTCEASEDLHNAAKQLFFLTKSHNIKIYLGDSRLFLKSLSKKICNNSIFFLDAHYSMGITSRKYGTCPLLDELKIIFDKSSEGIIVVDDLRTMNGKNGYPNLYDILCCIPNSALIEILYDQLIIYLKVNKNQL